MDGSAIIMFIFIVVDTLRGKQPTIPGAKDQLQKPMIESSEDFCPEPLTVETGQAKSKEEKERFSFTIFFSPFCLMKTPAAVKPIECRQKEEERAKRQKKRKKTSRKKIEQKDRRKARKLAEKREN